MQLIAKVVLRIVRQSKGSFECQADRAFGPACSSLRTENVVESLFQFLALVVASCNNRISRCKQLSTPFTESSIPGISEIALVVNPWR